MAISKIQLDNNTLIDLTSDTVTSSNMMSGITAHNSNGEVITGTFKYYENTFTDVQKAVTVNVGFTPKYVHVYRTDVSDWSTLASRPCATYDSSVSTGYISACQTNTTSQRALPNTNTTMVNIQNISGSNVKVYVNYAGSTWKLIAIG